MVRRIQEVWKSNLVHPHASKQNPHPSETPHPSRYCHESHKPHLEDHSTRRVLSRVLGQRFQRARDFQAVLRAQREQHRVRDGRQHTRASKQLDGVLVRNVWRKGEARSARRERGRSGHGPPTTSILRRPTHWHPPRPSASARRRTRCVRQLPRRCTSMPSWGRSPAP